MKALAQRQPGPTHADDLIQQSVLAVLLAEHPMQLTLLDLYRERTDPNDAAQRATVDDAVQALIAAGLAIRNGPFVVPSRAALRFEKLQAL